LDIKICVSCSRREDDLECLSIYNNDLIANTSADLKKSLGLRLDADSLIDISVDVDLIVEIHED